MSSNDTLASHLECRHIEPLLDDYVDGQLTAADQRRVETHVAGSQDAAGFEDVAGCEACGKHLVALEELLLQVDALPRSLPPASDLWPAVAPRLTRRPTVAGWPYWLRQAAAAVAFMALGGALSQLMPFSREGEAPPPMAETRQAQYAPDANLVLAEADFALAEADFLRAKEALWSAVYSSHDAASPETREVVERNLAVIAGAIRELRAALEADPGNHQLEGLLLAQHRSEIGLLRRLARATEI